MNCSTTPQAMGLTPPRQQPCCRLNWQIECMGLAKKDLAFCSLRRLRAGQGDANANCSGGEEKSQQPPGHILDYSVLYTAKQMQF